jgi:hypothetical protein
MSETPRAPQRPSSLLRLFSFLEHRNAWLAAALGTTVMVLFFVLTLDGATLRAAWQAISPRLFVITAALISINGLLDGLWLSIITRAPTRHAYRVVAWNMLLSSILPARLGDVGWMYFMHSWLAQPLARAVFVTFYHRLQDFIIVSLMLVLSLIVARSHIGGAPVMIAALLVLVAMALICTSLGSLLGVLAALLLRMHGRFRKRWLRAALEHVLRIRIWYRHRLQREQVLLSFVVILLRWVTILAAVAMVIRTLAAHITAGDSFLLANAYVYFGIVPLQSVGGFGTGEAGLAWMLTHYGVPLARASALGLFMRLLINLVHVLLWALVLGLLRLRGRGARAAG